MYKPLKNYSVKYIYKNFDFSVIINHYSVKTINQESDTTS